MPRVGAVAAPVPANAVENLDILPVAAVLPRMEVPDVLVDVVEELPPVEVA